MRQRSGNGPRRKGPTRHRVATAATAPACALATSRQGVWDAAAARTKRRAGVRPTPSICPTTAARAFDRSPSSIAHSTSVARGGVTKMNRPGSSPMRSKAGAWRRPPSPRSAGVAHHSTRAAVRDRGEPHRRAAKRRDSRASANKRALAATDAKLCPGAVGLRAISWVPPSSRPAAPNNASISVAPKFQAGRRFSSPEGVTRPDIAIQEKRAFSAAMVASRSRCDNSACSTATPP
jgi:hypothetical protein